MQYIADCTNQNCDHYLAAPSENQVVRSAKEHTTETDHDVKVMGRYDSPRRGGIYRDGQRFEMTSSERQAYEQHLRHRQQSPN